MSDIGERLRNLALDYPDKPWISEAADEIERLQQRINQLIEISAVEIHKRNNEIVQQRINQLIEISAVEIHKRNNEIAQLRGELEHHKNIHLGALEVAAENGQLKALIEKTTGFTADELKARLGVTDADPVP